MQRCLVDGGSGEEYRSLFHASDREDFPVRNTYGGPVQHPAKACKTLILTAEKARKGLFSKLHKGFAFFTRSF